MVQSGVEYGGASKSEVCRVVLKLPLHVTDMLHVYLFALNLRSKSVLSLALTHSSPLHECILGESFTLKMCTICCVLFF